MHEMQTIVTDVRGVCLSVCQPVRQLVCLSRGLTRGSTQLHCAKMAEQIKMMFGVNTPGGPWNIVSDGGTNLITYVFCFT